MQYFCNTPWIEAESLHLYQILTVLFKIHCGGIQRSNDQNKSVIGQKHLDLPNQSIKITATFYGNFQLFFQLCMQADFQ